MYRQFFVRTAALFAISLTVASCSDSDDSETATGAANAAGAEMTGLDPAMSFFVTSGPGPDGGNFGGLDGADAFCTSLAEAAGSTGKTWRAMLSTDTVDARDRIGSGPWYNAEGELFASDVESLFADGFPIDPADGDTPETDPKRLLFLDETGIPVPAAPDPLRHDILTGTLGDGTKAPTNCANWTSGAATDTGEIGHSDSRGGQVMPLEYRWVDAHNSQGCDLTSLNNTGGEGRIYCFAE